MRVLTIAAVLAAFSTGASAQSDRGTITGTVVDPDGRVVPGATVVAENPENGASGSCAAGET